jgi:hypothetical protein
MVMEGYYRDTQRTEKKKDSSAAGQQDEVIASLDLLFTDF